LERSHSLAKNSAYSKKNLAKCSVKGKGKNTREKKDLVLVEKKKRTSPWITKVGSVRTGGGGGVSRIGERVRMTCSGLEICKLKRERKKGGKWGGQGGGAGGGRGGQTEFFALAKRNQSKWRGTRTDEGTG